MSIRRNSLVVIIICTVLSCKENPVSYRHQGSSLPSERLNAIGDSLVNTGQILGLSVAIMEGSDTIFNKGFGYTDVRKTDPVTNETRFKIASISKLIGSTLIMKLAEEGKLSLDQNLLELLPDYPNREQAQEITLRHMLSNTSGLEDYAVEIDSAYVNTGVDPSKEDIYNFLKNRDLNFKPGSNYSYCNTGFYLMGLIVERITGKSFQTEINRVINAPTGMELVLISDALNDPKMSLYWELKKSGFIPYPHWPWIKGDGGLTATSIMLAQFPRFWANGKIIDPHSFESMTQPVVLNNGVETGYGIGVRNGEFLGERIIGHTGGHKSTYAIMVYFPARNLTFVCLINTDNTTLSARAVFAEFALEVLNKKSPQYEIQEMTNSNLSIYQGVYRNFDHKMENSVSIELNETNDHLYYCAGDDCKKMYYIGQNKFWIEEWPYDFISFNINSNQEVDALKEYYTGYYSVLRLKAK